LRELASKPLVPRVLIASSYDALKKYIYQLEKQQHDHETLNHASHRDLEHAALLQGHDVSDTDALFIPLLDRELKKITLFYQSQEKELCEDLTELEKDIQKQEDAGIDGGDRYMEQSDDEDDDESISILLSPEEWRRHRKISSTARTRRRTSIPTSFPSSCIFLIFFFFFQYPAPLLKGDVGAFPQGTMHAILKKILWHSQGPWVQSRLDSAMSVIA